MRKNCDENDNDIKWTNATTEGQNTPNIPNSSRYNNNDNICIIEIRDIIIWKQIVEVGKEMAIEIYCITDMIDAVNMNINKRIIAIYHAYLI